GGGVGRIWLPRTGCAVGGGRAGGRAGCAVGRFPAGHGGGGGGLAGRVWGLGRVRVGPGARFVLGRPARGPGRRGGGARCSGGRCRTRGRLRRDAARPGASAGLGGERPGVVQLQTFLPRRPAQGGETLGGGEVDGDRVTRAIRVQR